MDTAYAAWQADPTPENLGLVVDAAGPLITREVHRYAGPKTLLRGQAKLLASKAIKSYDPSRGAALSTWVTGQLQPLTRYGSSLKAQHVSEDVGRSSAEFANVEKRLSEELDHNPTEDELADHIGISVVKLRKVRAQTHPVVAEGTLQQTAQEDSDAGDFDPAIFNASNFDLAREAVYSALDARGKFIFDHKTGMNGAPVLSNQAIAAKLKVTPALVTQLSGDVAQRIMRMSQHAI